MKPFYNLSLLPILLSWLVLSPCTCHPTLDRNSITNIQCIDTERDALLKFKLGITSDNCGLHNSWVSHTDCCQWHGVRCSNLTGHVILLRLVGKFPPDFNACLEGDVSPSLGELKYLKHLNLSFNEFFGDIPHELGNLSKLTTLDLQYAYIGNARSLSWISSLSLLTYLDLSGFYLGNVTSLMTIVSNLHSLSVLRCGLDAKSLSSLSYVNSSTTLHTISLSCNNFNDTSIFQWLFNFPRITTQLVYLDLSKNSFQGPIPGEFKNFSNLSYLSLSYNNFQGSVSNITSKLCNLKQLYLGVNNLTDELRDVIQSFVNCDNNALLTMDLSHNSFSGAIPDTISSLSRLTELHLNNNKLKGEISRSIGQLTTLESLDVSYNSFNGTLTHTHFLNLSSLRELHLSENSGLVINMDEDWIPPFQLDTVSLRSCNLGLHFPKWLQLHKNFSYFDVSNAGISDNVPVSFWKSLSSNLRYLNLSCNRFYGMLPNLPDTLQINQIDLSSNMFEGVVPSAFANSLVLYLNHNMLSDCSYIICPKTTSDLLRLDLSNNLFTGRLPDCWMNLSQLTTIHLENNRFFGSIPNSMGTLSRIQYLHLFNNSFSGPFPAAFESFTSLIILNLGYNLFTGSIPPWIGNFSQSLGALILRKNHFIGEMPESICQLKHLQILDLAINHISGAIPNCIGNLVTMKGSTEPGLYFFSDETINNNRDIIEIDKVETVTVSWKREEQIFKTTVSFVLSIDLSCNLLSGKIPNGISILNGLESLDLSKNNLSGNIPFEIGNLTVLELLNLSNNHLTGKIPTSLAKVTTLDIVDVSNNNLSGKIPVSTRLQSFNASSYAGNSGLCGAPLPSCSRDRAPSNVPNGDITRVPNKDDDFIFFLGLYISVILGFIVGFWGVCGTLIIKTSWRYAYFRLLDNIKNKIL